MKSITIHKLDTELSKAIESLSDSTGLSQNKVIKKLLRRALGLEGARKKEDFSEFLGVWDQDEFDDFNEAMKDFEVINDESWK